MIHLDLNVQELTFPLHRSSGLMFSTTQPSLLAPSITRFWFSRAWWMFLTFRFNSEGGTIPLLMRFSSLLQRKDQDSAINNTPALPCICV